MPDETYEQQLELGKIAFDAYSEKLNHTNHQGNRIPAWADLGDAVQAGWIAAAAAVSEELTGPESAD